MDNPHQLYIDLRKTDLLIAEFRHRLDCQYRLIAGLHQQRARAWLEKLRARQMEKHMTALCMHRDALIQAVAATQASVSGHPGRDAADADRGTVAAPRDAADDRTAP
ncbi:hypothetical protein ACL598_16705 [Bordetella bronchialis]|uniref:Uncharacterized protein n=1 Tax=Bordetella bronchialis TaxID=463025 RepID=A0A193FYW4_9BORD|nr:hypothetical protein [Bordetella bronchialis]ANN72952.1 hypothetical protein BAU08_17790 [Bordetella bronchialis]